MSGLVFFSSRSGNTARFIERLGRPALRIAAGPAPEPDAPFILVTPTFADGEGRGAVPKAVIAFLNEPRRRALLRGVIGAGNRNFGATFALAGRVVAQKCGVPLLYTFELQGSDTDLARVNDGLNRFWRQQCSITA